MAQLKINVIQDGEKISDNFIDIYDLSGKDFTTTYSAEEEQNIRYSSFVGLVRSKKDDSLLVSIPKHYMEISKFKKLTEAEKISHIRTIINSIGKSDEYEDTVYNRSKDIKGDFSFKAYYAIYDYYQKLGLYHDEDTYFKKGYGNHISWRKTISKSNKYMVDGNLFMLPFVQRRKKRLSSLITDCMIFTFNYTEVMYGVFMNLPDTSKLREYGINQTILNNCQGVINQLFQIKTKTFKDSTNELIDNLILFLKRVNSKSKKTKFSIKDWNYAYVWENAVEKYLNDKFNGVKDNQFIFDDQGNHYFFKKNRRKYAKDSDWRLEPDHYYYDKKDKALYLFDSKYYRNLKDLNHKQLVYHFLFKHREKAEKVYDALVVPTEGPSTTKVHVEILREFLALDNNGKFEEIKIYDQRLNTVKVIANYCQ